MKKFSLAFGFILLSSIWGLAQIHSIIIPATAFLPRRSEDDVQTRNTYLAPVQGAFSYTFWGAPLMLPEGAEIIKMVVFFEDNYVHGFLRVHLRDHNLYTDSSETKFLVSSEELDDSPGMRTMKDYDGRVKIKNGGHQYAIYLHLEPGNLESVKLYAVKLVYTLDD